MADREIQTCSTCPAFIRLIGEGKAGTCRARPPAVFQSPEYFRGSTRSMLFGAYPAVGTFPLVKHSDYCMEHPDNRAIFMHGGTVVTPQADSDAELTEADAVDKILGENGAAPGAAPPQAAPQPPPKQG